MPIYEDGEVRIRYEEIGVGLPLLVIPGGGLNSGISFLKTKASLDAPEELKDRYRCITLDLRNSGEGESVGPLEVDRPWDTHTDDQLAVLDHLGIEKFMVMGFCIGGPLAWNLLKRAPDRVIAAAIVQPSGFRPELPDLFYNNNMNRWGPELCAKRPDITPTMVEKFLSKMYRSNPDFVFTVDRDFVRGCHTPILVLPDDIPGHPFEVAMESALLAPNAQVSFFPWREPTDRIPLAVRHIRTFLRAHEPADPRSLK